MPLFPTVVTLVWGKGHKQVTKRPTHARPGRHMQRCGGSSKETIAMIHVCYHTTAFHLRWPLSGGGGGRVWHKASVSDCLPLAAPIGLSPLLILTLCGPERVLVVSTEPQDDLSRLTTPGVSRPRDGAVARAVDRVYPDAQPESMRGFADSSPDLSALGCASAGAFS